MIDRFRSPFGLLMVGLVALLVVAALSTVGDTAAEIGQGWVPGISTVEPVQPDDERVGDPLEAVQTPPLLRAFLSIVFMVVLLVLGLLVLLGMLITIVGFHTSRGRRARQGETAMAELSEDDEADLQLVTRAAKRARAMLAAREGGAPGDAVVQAWLTLEEATAAAGLTRKPHQTPTEFTTEVLTGLRVDAAALDRLRGLYQRARFSSRPVTEDDVTAACAALDRLVADLETPAGAPA